MDRALCPTPHKQLFSSKAEAKLFLKRNADYYSKQVRIYVYRCECGGHHLSKSRNNSNLRPPARPLVHLGKFEKLIRK